MQEHPTWMFFFYEHKKRVFLSCRAKKGFLGRLLSFFSENQKPAKTDLHRIRL